MRYHQRVCKKVKAMYPLMVPLIAAIEHPPVIAKILAHLGLPAPSAPEPQRGQSSAPTGLISNRYPIQSGSSP